jgi:hypothetical protein
LPRAELCAVPVRSIVTADPTTIVLPDDGYIFSDHYYNGTFVSGLYGLGGGFNIAYFRIDKERRQMIVSGSVPNDEIVLEYISTGVSKHSTTLIPYQALAALKAYIHWQRIEYDNNYGTGEKQRKQRLFDEECQALTSFECKITKDEFLDSCYRNFKQSAKR